MPGYHVVVCMLPCVGFRLPTGRTFYAPAAVRDYFAMIGAQVTMWPAGVFTIVSTRAQDWRHYELYHSFHPWHAVPFAHGGYQRIGNLTEVDAEWRQAFAMVNHFNIESTPEQLCDTTGFIKCFVRPLTRNIYRLTYIMSNYDKGCDFYTRFSVDEPEEAYQHMHAPISDPTCWWTILREPEATRRTQMIAPGDWAFVPMQIMASAQSGVARL